MLKENAEAFVELGERIHDARVIWDLGDTVEPHPDTGRARLTDKGRLALQIELTRLLEVAKKLSLKVSTKLIGRRLGYDTMPTTEAEYEVLVEVLKDELQGRLFLFVPEHRAGHFDQKYVMVPDGAKAFPTAEQELREAATCYAAGLPTACVYHSMRALEPGLRALATAAGLTFSVQQWGNIIDEIQGKITDMQRHGIPSLNKADKDAKLQFLSQAATQFAYFKDGWRNFAMHTKGSYSEHQALTTMTHVRDFLEGLAPELHE